MQRKRVGILIVSCLVIGIAPLVKASVTFHSMQRQLDTLFSEGVNGDGLSIAAEIAEKQSVVSNCITVAEQRYRDQVDAAVLSQAHQAVEQMTLAQTVQAISQAEAQLDQAFAALIHQLEGAALSAQDQRYVIGFQSDYAAAEDRISRDGYHQAAQKVQQECSGPLAQLLMRLSIGSLEMYQGGEE